MAQRKNYFPNRVSRNERLAYQLIDDREIVIKDVLRRRRPKNNYRGEKLADFISVKTHNRIHVF